MNCPLATTCSCGHHLDLHPEDGHCTLMSGEKLCECMGFASKGKGFVLGVGDPVKAQLAIILEAPGKEEISFPIDGVGAPGIIPPKELETRMLAYSHLICGKCASKLKYEEGNQDLRILQLGIRDQKTFDDAQGPDGINAGKNEILFSGMSVETEEQRTTRESKSKGRERIHLSNLQQASSLSSSRKEGQKTGNFDNNSSNGLQQGMSKNSLSEGETRKPGNLVGRKFGLSEYLGERRTGELKKEETSQSSDGEEARKKIGDVGTRSSYQRSEARQSRREFVDSSYSSPLWRSSLSALYQHFPDSIVCPVCDSNTFSLEPDFDIRFMKIGAGVVGKSGSLLNQWVLPKVGVKREEIFIDNTLRCLPPNNGQGQPYPTKDEKSAAEVCCRAYDRVQKFEGKVVEVTLHPAGILREVTPLPLLIKDMEKASSFVRQGFRTLVLMGGKAAGAFLGYAENVSRWRGHYEVLTSPFKEWYDSGVARLSSKKGKGGGKVRKLGKAAAIDLAASGLDILDTPSLPSPKFKRKRRTRCGVCKELGGHKSGCNTSNGN